MSSRGAYSCSYEARKIYCELANAQPIADSAKEEPLKRSPSNLASPTVLRLGASPDGHVLGTRHWAESVTIVNKIEVQLSEDNPVARQKAVAGGDSTQEASNRDAASSF
jgi:hypothetical protein